MIPIDPRFPSLLIRSYDMIRYDRYIRVSSICNPSVFFSPVLYDTSPDLFVLLQCYTKFKSINLTTCIHTLMALIWWRDSTWLPTTIYAVKTWYDIDLLDPCESGTYPLLILLDNSNDGNLPNDTTVTSPHITRQKMKDWTSIRLFDWSIH